MKRAKQLYPKLIEIPNIIHIYRKQIKLNTKNKKKLEKFEEFFAENIVDIKRKLQTKTYVVGKYNIFLIKAPKLRIIMSQEIKDKIINHLVAKYCLSEVLDSCLLDCNVATRINKGTHYGISLTKKYIQIMKKQYPVFYMLKFDISKYFYSIDHQIVKDMLKRKIKDEEALQLLFQIIDSTDESYVNRKIEALKERFRKKISASNRTDKEKILRDINKIPFYRKGKGLPIGNMTSQILAIYYLNDLDYYIKEELKIKYYIRYMDDGVLFHHDREYLKYCLEKITEFLKGLQLQLNTKTAILNSKNGLDFLGFRFVIMNNHFILKPHKTTRNRFKRKMKKLYKLQLQGKIIDKDVQQVLASYRGHLSHGNSYRLIQRTMQELETIGKECVLEE